MQDRQKTALSRRGFLGVAGGMSAATVATVAALGPEEVQAYNPGEEEARARYRETDHVKAFYRVNGYETLKK